MPLYIYPNPIRRGRYCEWCFNVYLYNNSCYTRATCYLALFISQTQTLIYTKYVHIKSNINIHKYAIIMLIFLSLMIRFFARSVVGLIRCVYKHSTCVSSISTPSVFAFRSTCLHIFIYSNISCFKITREKRIYCFTSQDKRLGNLTDMGTQFCNRRHLFSGICYWVTHIA